MTAVQNNVRRIEETFEEGQQQIQARSSMAIATTKAAQEVQAAMVVAKRFPRNPLEASSRIRSACQRKGLAEQAIYSYPRGSTTVTGPSIRLAEALAQAWGNLDFGIVELSQENGESSVMAYCWDLETNTRQTKVFTVKHERHTKKGMTDLTDPRDIYELVANQGARRLRSCILGVVPGDVVDEAVTLCEKTLAGASSEPLIDRVKKMVIAFWESFSITPELIEKRLGHKLEVTTEAELVNLRKIYVSLRDNMAPRESYFDLGGAPASGNGATDAAPIKEGMQSFGKRRQRAADQGSSDVASGAPDAPVAQTAAVAGPKAAAAPANPPSEEQIEQEADEVFGDGGDAPVAAPGGAPPVWQQAMIAYAEMYSVEYSTAEQRITEFSRKIYKADPQSLAPQQATDLLANVINKSIKPRPIK